MMEIHFYAGGEFLDDYKIENMTSITHYGFRREFNKRHPIIHTVSMIDLGFYLIEEGYKIFIHENGRILEIYPGMVSPSGKEIRYHHDVRKLWQAGVWDDYFYPEFKDISNKINNFERLDLE